GQDAAIAALHSQRSGLTPCNFESAVLDTWIGEVSGLDNIHVRSDLGAYDCRSNRLAQLGLQTDGFAGGVAAAAERIDARRIGVVIGTSTSGILETELAYRRRDAQTGALPPDYRYSETQNSYSPADFVQRYLGLKGPAFVVSSACSSSAKVFAHAARLMAAGVCDAVVVGGVDTLCLTTLYGFNALELLSPAPCRPYDADRDGISIGEGAAFALLEKAPGKPAANAIMLLGIGESCDAHHMSAPHPEGQGAILAMRSALAAAGLASDQIDYVNLHGTATRANDASEDHAVFALFGGQVPVSSTKGSTGHLLGAAGITEAIIASLAIRNELLPGGVHTKNIDPALRCNYLLENRGVRVQRVLSNSFGFGGSNCCLILGRNG
ncbi:MAG: beta-ketoacyl-[acyl-carrier-protein] synthase family protein, partial [Betaproteobacteria bacterium]